MTMHLTESFIAYPRSVELDSGTPGTTARTLAASLLPLFGYRHFSSAIGNYGFQFRDDPVVPERCAMVMSNNVNNASGGPYCAFSVPLPARGGNAVIAGFSVYIPSEFVPHASATTPLMYIGLTTNADASWQAISGSTKNLCYFRADLQCVSVTQTTPQNSTKLKAGTLNYIEVRYDGTTCSVWVDDVLVHQHTSTITSAESLVVAFHNTSNAPIDLLKGRWAFGNVYALVTDATAPNSRLGMTTRVIGKRAASDVVVDFIRPPGFDSNAEVVSQDMAVAPADFLIGTDLGDTDIYAAPDTVVVGAALVHAVAVKALVTNNTSSVHGVKGVVISNGDEVESAEVSLPVLGGYRTVRAVFNTDPDTSAAWVGSAASSAGFGIRISS